MDSAETVVELVLWEYNGVVGNSTFYGRHCEMRKMCVYDGFGVIDVRHTAQDCLCDISFDCSYCNINYQDVLQCELCKFQGTKERTDHMLLSNPFSKMCVKLQNNLLHT